MNNNHGRRRTRRVRQQRKQKNTQISRILLTVGLMALIAVVSIGGTIAWLTDDTDTITNTFTPSGIDITLIETKNPDGTVMQEGESWTAQIIPGKEYCKDPVVTVEGSTNVDVYLFVEYTDTAWRQYLNYELAWETDKENWKKLEGVDNVWYREVSANTEDQSWHLLKDDRVTVSDTLTKEQMTSVNLQMAFRAYAIQQDEIEANDTLTAVQVAWQTVSGKTITTP